MKKFLYSLIFICICTVSQAQTHWQIEQGTEMDSLFQKLAWKIYKGKTSDKIFWQGYARCPDKTLGEKCMTTKSIIAGSQKINGTLTQLLIGSDQIIKKWCKPDDRGEIRGSLGFNPADIVDRLNSGNLDLLPTNTIYRLQISMWEQPEIAPGKVTVLIIVSRKRYAEERWTLFWDRNMTTNIVQKLELDTDNGIKTIYTFNELTGRTSKIITKN